MENLTVNINPIKTSTPVRLEPAAKPVARRDENPLAQENLNATTHDNLMGQLRQMPDSRPDAVELGKKLASDPHYPSDDVLDKLAEIILDLTVSA